jgi:hypothetical protein
VYEIKRDSGNMGQFGTGLRVKRLKMSTETRLAQAVIATVNAGGHLLCSLQQYAEVRRVLSNLGTDAAKAEIARLDVELNWQQFASGNLRVVGRCNLQG